MTIIFDNFSIDAGPAIVNAHCPRHGLEMRQQDDGWYSYVWRCPKCKYPYQIRMVKMKRAEHVELTAALRKSKKIKVNEA